MNLTIVPFGNAKISGSKVTCQHGEKECEGNSWEQCGIAHNPDPKDHFPYYECMEASKGKPNFKSAAQSCAKEAGIEFGPIETCFNGEEGASLQKKYAKLTPSDHKYTPWVTLNGKVMPQRGTFIKHLCEAWTAEGGARPAGCPRLTDEKPEPCPAEW